MSEDLRELFSSSPRQTFVLFPLATFAVDLLRGRPRFDARWSPLLLLGYALYRYAGDYRDRAGAGSRGFEKPPERLVTDGPYAYSRNPMYLGHLLFMAGLVLTTRSPLALVLAARQWQRFSERARVDEERLEPLFGDEYRDYRARVPPWLALEKLTRSLRERVTAFGASGAFSRFG